MQEKHAKHNEEVCNFLNNSGKPYEDWVVTTAFYSALHYVQHEIFPRKISGVMYPCFDTYYSSIKSPSISKHKMTHQLVDKYIGNKPAEIYRALMDSCMSARYSNYMVSPQIASSCVSRLGVLKSYLKK